MSDYEVIKKIPGWQITLYKRKGDLSPNIYFYFRLNKKSYRGTTGTSNLEESEKISIGKYFDIKERKDDAPKSVKFEVMIDKFLAYKQGRVGPKTWKEYNRQSKYLIEFFTKREVNSFTREDYDNYEIWRRHYYENNKKRVTQKYVRGGKKLTGRKYGEIGNITLNREIGLLVSILTYSFDLGYTSKVYSYKRLPENRREDILTKDEYLKLRNYWLLINPYYWTIISFINNTGIRYPQELNNIKYGDVNLDKSFVVIRKRKGKPPKDMSIPLVGNSKKIIEKLKARQGISTGPDDYVFVNDRGVRIQNIKVSFQKSIKACEITKNITMYSLRHLFTTRTILTRPDISLAILAKVLGHVDTTMVEKVYSHLMIDGIVKVFETSEQRRQQILEEREKHPDSQKIRQVEKKALRRLEELKEIKTSWETMTEEEEFELSENRLEEITKEIEGEGE